MDIIGFIFGGFLGSFLLRNGRDIAVVRIFVLVGKVRVRIVINPDGSVAETEILEKCEHEVLNEACLDAIKKSAPFKKMKKSQNAITLTFVMDFSLKIKS